MTDSNINTANLPTGGRDAVYRALGCSTRFVMLKALAGGESIGAGELGKMAGCNMSTSCKHLLILWQAGLIEQGRGRLYRIFPRFLNVTEHVADFGYCVVRFDVERPAS